jgi:hypothetical protein
MIRRKSTRGAWPDILALMAPEAAQRLTVELATRARGSQGRTGRPAQDRGAADHARGAGPQGAGTPSDRRLAGAVSE